MKVALLHDAQAGDGRVDEQDALVQMAALRRCLRELGHETVEVGFGLDLAASAQRLRELAPDVAVNLVESVAGHGRLIHLAPSLLETLGIPFTGCDARAMFLSSDKLWSKRLLLGAGIDTPAWVDAFGASEGSWRFPARAIVKSVWEDASLGLDDDSVVEARSRQHLQAEIRTRSAQLGGEAFAEAWIEGREFNLSLLEENGHPRVLPPAEIRFEDFPTGKPRMVGYRAKWQEDSFEYSHTPRSFDFAPEDGPLLEKLRSIAVACWRLLGLRGYARVDFRVDGDGRPWVLELNANPCLSPDAGFVAAGERAELDLRSICARILATALDGDHQRVPHSTHL